MDFSSTLMKGCSDRTFLQLLLLTQYDDMAYIFDIIVQKIQSAKLM